FEYMSAGLATASADLVEMRLLTQSHGLGVLFDPTDVEGLARQLNDLLADPERLDGFRRQAWQSAVETFHWEREEERLREYLRPFLDGL
ncbi:MAG TPA: hypothetical protein VNO81_13995, partial [Candidatus Nitrosotenuis sp.]|nr:hypothetical protein [Candidatus Nitrosotenuis sp.]